MDQQHLVLEHRFRLEPEPARCQAWAAAENVKGHHCACGCGGQIRVLARHHAAGTPRYIKGHHQMAVERELADLRRTGFLTTADAAKALGIGQTTLRRLEGTAYSPRLRRGKYHVRTFRALEVEAIRQWLSNREGSIR